MIERVGMRYTPEQRALILSVSAHYHRMNTRGTLVVAVNLSHNEPN